MKLEHKLESLEKHFALPRGQADSAPVERSLPTTWGEICLGDFEVMPNASSFVVSNTYMAEHQHGIHTFSGLHALKGEAFSVVSRDPELSFTDLSGAVFLDTETTGLGMGTGTYVFLVGAGFMDGDRFVVRQFFLDSPGDERNFLAALNRFLKPFPVLVTFNGKAFDWPLLENRYRLHRQNAPFDDPVHVDLLHPARRIWKRRLPSCALNALEAQVLGVERSRDDVPGWEIPFRYFQYQRSGDAAPLQSVFYHNLVDVLSLATLAVHIDRVVSDPSCGLLRHATDFFCVGKVYEMSGDGDMAVFCYEEALRRGLAADVQSDCRLRLGTLHKRERRWDLAIVVWEALLEDGGSAALAARVELAKFYEHVDRDYVTAIEHVQHALSLTQLHDSPWPDANQRDLEHRLSRLLNRSLRSRAWTGSYG